MFVTAVVVAVTKSFSFLPGSTVGSHIREIANRTRVGVCQGARVFARERVQVNTRKCPPKSCLSRLLTPGSCRNKKVYEQARSK